jgi:hypothetical protein
MSIKIMADVWSNGPTDKAQLLVLLALADFADDNGSCWPSVAAVGVKARMSERNARRVIRDLEAAGHLSVVTGGGRFGCSQYVVGNPDKSAQNPDKKTPGQIVPPGQNQHKTRTKQVGNPDIAMSAEPSRTIKEPSEVRKNMRDVVLEILCEVHGVSEVAAGSFIAYRRKHKSKALTETAAKRLAKHLWDVVGQGGDPSDALGMAEERGWASVEASWYFNSKGNSHGNRTQGSTSGNSRAGSGTVAAFAAVAARIGGYPQ